MEVLNSPAVVASVFLFTAGLVGWMIRELYAWVKTLTKDVTALTTIVAVLGEKYDNHDEEIKTLKTQVANMPTVRYRK